MNVKIQGGNDAYSNTGSCSNIAYYLEHEDYVRMYKGLKTETFFDQNNDGIDRNTLVKAIDNNRAKLCKKDAKFFVLTISPSQAELLTMGRTEEERSASMKRFVRENIIPQYAEGFGKDLSAEDILYFAKIHHWRGKNKELQTHAHIIISRKTKDNRIKISPKTNHQSKSKSGAVKSGFNRTNFYTQVEACFDKMFNYKRPEDEKFEYLNMIKNGNIDDLVDYVENKPLKTVKQKVEESKKRQVSKKRGLKL